MSEVSFLLLIYTLLAHQSNIRDTFGIVDGALFRSSSRGWVVFNCHFSIFLVFRPLSYLLQVFICILNIRFIGIFLGAFGQVVTSARFKLILRNLVDFLVAMLRFRLYILQFVGQSRLEVLFDIGKTTAFSRWWIVELIAMCDCLQSSWSLTPFIIMFKSWSHIKCASWCSCRNSFFILANLGAIELIRETSFNNDLITWGLRMRCHHVWVIFDQDIFLRWVC